MKNENGIIAKTRLVRYMERTGWEFVSDTDICSYRMKPSGKWLIESGLYLSVAGMSETFTSDVKRQLTDEGILRTIDDWCRVAARKWAEDEMTGDAPHADEFGKLISENAVRYELKLKSLREGLDSILEYMDYAELKAGAWNKMDGREISFCDQVTGHVEIKDNIGGGDAIRILNDATIRTGVRFKRNEEKALCWWASLDAEEDLTDAAETLMKDKAFCGILRSGILTLSDAEKGEAVSYIFKSV